VNAPNTISRGGTSPHNTSSSSSRTTYSADSASSYLRDVDRLLSRVRKAREERKRTALPYNSHHEETIENGAPLWLSEGSKNGNQQETHDTIANPHFAITTTTLDSPTTSVTTKDDEIRALIEESNRLLSQEFDALQRRKQRVAQRDTKQTQHSNAMPTRAQTFAQDDQHISRQLAGDRNRQDNIELLHGFQKMIDPEYGVDARDDDNLSPVALDHRNGTASSQQRNEHPSLSHAMNQLQHPSLQLSFSRDHNEAPSTRAHLFPHLQIGQEIDLVQRDQEKRLERDSLSLEYIVDEDAENGPSLSDMNAMEDAPFAPQLKHASDRATTAKSYRTRTNRLLSPSKERKHSRSPQLRHEQPRQSRRQKESRSSLFDHYNDVHTQQQHGEEEHQKRVIPTLELSPRRSKAAPPSNDKYSTMTLQDVLQLVNQTSEEIRSMSPVSSPRLHHPQKRHFSRSPSRASTPRSPRSPSRKRGSIGRYRNSSRISSPARSLERQNSGFSRHYSNSRSPQNRFETRSARSSASPKEYQAHHYTDDQESVYSRRASLAQSQRKSLNKSTTFIPYSDVRHLQSRGAESTSYNHSTMHWFLNLCSEKKMKQPSNKKKRVAWVGLSSNGRGDKKLYPNR